MRYGILGDIHSNLSALEVALENFERQEVEQVISVGDVVGYGAAPRECIALLREVGALVVKGNHDAACVGELDERMFNDYAREAIRWTRTILETEDQAWLRALPHSARTDHLEVSHGCLADPERYPYVQLPGDAEPSLDHMQRPICFIGHTHIPITFIRPVHPGRTDHSHDPELQLAGFDRVLVNVGSVGQPRDQDPRSAHAIFDSEECGVRIHRRDYDIEVEAERIRSAGLPGMLAERLHLGL